MPSPALQNRAHRTLLQPQAFLLLERCMLGRMVHGFVGPGPTLRGKDMGCASAPLPRAAAAQLKPEGRVAAEACAVPAPAVRQQELPGSCAASVAAPAAGGRAKLPGSCPRPPGPAWHHHSLLLAQPAQQQPGV